MQGSSASVVAAVLTAVTLFALAGFQVTNETAGVRLLGRVGSALIELDRWLPAHQDDLELQARDRPDAPVILPDLPMQVAVSSAVVLEGPGELLRDSISHSMGVTLYRQGPDAVRDEAGDSHFTFTEPVRWTIDLLGEGAHGFWRIAVIVLSLSLLAVCAGMLWTRQSPLLPMAIGGAASAGLSLLAWGAALGISSSMDGAVDREIALVLRDGAWIGLRNGLAVTVIALAALFVVSALIRHRDEMWDEPWEELEIEYEQSQDAPQS